MGSESARQIMFCEKDGDFPEHMLHIGGSCGLVTINGVLSIITARHCIERYMAAYPHSPRHGIATLRQVGFQNRFAIFSNIFYVTNGDGRPGVIGDECDLAICKTNPTDGLSSPDAFPLINGSNSGFDPEISVDDNLLCYGFPDISGPYLTDRTIAYNPSRIQLTVTNFEQSGMIGVARIEGIEDYSGNTYPINSSLNGLSGGPIFRANGHSECFSGLAIMAGNGVLRFLTSLYIVKFAGRYCA